MADKLIYFDGHYYKNKEDVPDIGSFVATSYKKGIRNYEGLSKDVSKLPKYKDLETGSSAFCLDTGELYKYEKTTQTWYKL